MTICGENTPPEWTWSGPIRIFEDSSDVVDMYEKMVDNEQAPSQISYTILYQASPNLVGATIDGHELFLSTLVADFTAAYADTLTLKADDGGYQDTVTVAVNIAPINDAPVAADESYSIDEGGVVVGDDDESDVFLLCHPSIYPVPSFHSLRDLAFYIQKKHSGENRDVT